MVTAQAPGKYSHTQAPPRASQALAPTCSLKADKRANPHILLPGGCFISLHPSGSPRQQIPRENKSVLSFSLIPAQAVQLSAANQFQALLLHVPVPKKGKTPWLPASQPSRCRARIRKAHTHPQFSIARHMSKGKSLHVL